MKNTADEPPVRPTRMEDPRLRRMRALSNLLDSSIQLPGGYRIGLDPLLGFIPGLGDLLGSAFSFFLVYQAAQLGIPKRVLARMIGNIALEALVGSIPVAGDVFDAFWKANNRNMDLVEKSFHLDLKPRPSRNVARGVLALIVAAFLGILTLLFLLVNWIAGLLGA